MFTLIFILFLILLIIVLLMTPSGHRFQAKIKFFVTGKDSGFSLKEILLLKKVAEAADLKDPSVLYWSLEAFDKSLTAILADFERRGVSSRAENQDFLAKLYKYRTQIEFDTPKYKKGISSTRELDVGQRVSIIVKHIGVYRAYVVQNTSHGLFLSYPVATTAKVAAPQWVGQSVNVYFLRKDDASYDFESKAMDEVFVHGKPALCLGHSFSLFRTQKRKSVRAVCSEPAVLYILKNEENPELADCSTPGSKCRLEDISEDGAAVLAGGRGIAGLRIRIDLLLGGKPVSMSGEVRAVDYDEKNNVSRLHLECSELNSDVKNIILSYVYKIMPESDKEVYDALRVLEEDADEFMSADAPLNSDTPAADVSADVAAPEPDSDYLDSDSDDKEEQNGDNDE